MTLPDILKLTGVRSRTTILRWIDQWGFPEPVEKGGGRAKAAQWNRTDVLDWWRINKDSVGRHPK